VRVPQNEAAKNIVMMDLAILQAEAAAGMYKKPIEALAKEIHYEPMSGKVRAGIIAAWPRGTESEYFSTISQVSCMALRAASRSECSKASAN
jgi:hypothetical protein